MYDKNKKVLFFLILSFLSSFFITTYNSIDQVVMVHELLMNKNANPSPQIEKNQNTNITNNKNNSSKEGFKMDTAPFVSFVQKYLSNIAHEEQKIQHEIEKYTENNKLSKTQPSPVVDVLRKIHEILMELVHVKNDFEKFFREHDDIINTFLQESIFFHEKKKIARKVSIENIRNLILIIKDMQLTLDFLDKEIDKAISEKKIYEEQIKKTLAILKDQNVKSITHHDHNDNVSEILPLKIDQYQKLLFISQSKLKEFELKILELRRYTLREKMRLNSNLLSKTKQKLVLNSFVINKIFTEEKKKQKILFLERDKLIKDLTIIDEKIISIKKKYEKLYDLNDILDAYVYATNEEKDDLLLLSILCAYKEYGESKLKLISSQLLHSNKNIDFADGWSLLNKNNLSHNDIKLALTKLNSDSIKIEIVENEKNTYATKSLLQKNESLNFDEVRIETLQMYLQSLLPEFNFDKKIIKNILSESLKNYINGDTLLHESFFLVSYIEEELNAKSFWSRSQYSIAADQVKNFFPDLVHYAKQIVSGFVPFLYNTYDFFLFKSSVPYWQVFIFIFAFILVFVFGFFYLSFTRWVGLLIIRSKGAYSFWTLLLLDFIKKQGLRLYIFVTTYLLFLLNIIPSSYAYGIFCLTSMCYSLYILYIFHGVFQELNNKKDFILVSYDYTKRLIRIVSTLLYISCIMFFIRESFTKILPNSTSVPIILFAAQFILIQVAIIFLLTKEQLLHFIPSSNPFLIGLKYFLDAYYLLFLTGIIIVMIMSNPYVGYGSQVIYFLTRSVFTVIFIPILNRLFNYIKDHTLNFFVYINDPDLSNRIPSGKLCYTLFITFMFTSLLVLFVLILGKIWEFNITIESLNSLVNYNLLSNNVTENSEIDFISLYNIGIILSILFIGYISSHLLFNLILKRIFNPLIISPSLQQTIMTLMQYFMVILSFFMALFKVQLQGITTKIAVIIGFLGFALREPFADFISYFIILITRPVKIGDLIRITRSSGSVDAEIIGIVRQITARTTLIRQNNSHTIIVPNTLIITQFVFNWNYVRGGFVGIDDIRFNVDFEENPEEIRTILASIVDSHHAILKNPSPVIRCERFTESGYEFLIRCYIPSDRAIDRWEVASQLRILIIKRLRDDNNIKISAPKHNIFLHQSDEENKRKKIDK